MKKIKVKQLTQEGFCRYGTFQNLLDDESLALNSVRNNPDSGFFPDLAAMDFGHSILPTVSVCRVPKKEENIVSFLEYHQFTSEGLIPLDGDVVICIGVPENKFSTDNLEAFYIPKGTFVRLNPLIVHGPQFSIEAEVAHVACLLAGRTFKNDITYAILNYEDEKAEVVFK